ncbi:MAG: DNA polymerase III subunit chi [Myxococcota bacterium]
MARATTGAAGKTKVTFYDIAPDQTFALAVKLAQAAWEKEKRLIIRCHDAPHAAALDEHLWVFREDAFLPHEVCDDPQAMKDPTGRIVLTTRDARPIAGDILLQLAPCELGFAGQFEVVIDLVDHSDQARLEASRARYRAWLDAGTKPDMKQKV